MELESRSRMAKILELQRRLRLQRAFKKIVSPPAPDPSNYYVEDDDVEYTDVEMLDEIEEEQNTSTAQMIDDSFYEAGFDRYDIVELNGDGTAGEAFSESVIIKHSHEMTMQQALEPEVKIQIKSEPEDVYEPPLNLISPDFNLIPPNLVKTEPNNYHYGMAHPTLAQFQDAELNRIKQELLKSCEGDLLKPKIIEKKKLTWKYSNDNNTKKQDGGLECEICGKRFTYRRSFKQHRIDHKLQNDCIECRVCGKMLKPSAMDYHMNYKHSEERKFQCLVCGRRFKSPGAMKHHVVTQHKDDEEFQYECRECGKFFDTADQLAKHSKVVHGEIFVRFFATSFNEFIFSDSIPEAGAHQMQILSGDL